MPSVKEKLPDGNVLDSDGDVHDPSDYYDAIGNPISTPDTDETSQDDIDFEKAMDSYEREFEAWSNRVEDLMDKSNFNALMARQKAGPSPERPVRRSQSREPMDGKTVVEAYHRIHVADKIGEIKALGLEPEEEQRQINDFLAKDKAEHKKLERPY